LQPTEEIAGSSTDEVAENGDNDTVMPSLSMYGLSDQQTKLLELAIANAASAAQAQAEAEAALEEEEDYFQDDEDYDQSDGEANVD
jgi:Tfp pilus assembly protein PilX